MRRGSTCRKSSTGSGLSEVVLKNRARFGLPDFGRVLGDRPVAGKLPRAGYVQACFAGPGVAVPVQLAEPLIGLQIRSEVRQVHVVVAVCQQRVMNRNKSAKLIAAEIIGGYQVQCGPGFRLVVVMPVRVVPGGAVSDLLRGEAEQE